MKNQHGHGRIWNTAPARVDRVCRDARSLIPLCAMFVIPSVFGHLRITRLISETSFKQLSKNKLHILIKAYFASLLFPLQRSAMSIAHDKHKRPAPKQAQCVDFILKLA